MPPVNDDGAWDIRAGRQDAVVKTRTRGRNPARSRMDWGTTTNEIVKNATPKDRRKVMKDFIEELVIGLVSDLAVFIGDYVAFLG
ncbi:MAG: hypothetical protein PVI86_05585 [Phycisphaerae bacterium]